MLEKFAGRQGGDVFCDVDAALIEFKKFDLFGLFPSTQDDTEGRVLAGLLFMFGKPAEVEFHLSFVFRLEVAEFEIDGDEAFQSTMIE